MLTLTPASLVMLWYNFYSGDEIVWPKGCQGLFIRVAFDKLGLELNNEYN